jgi:phosphohistidine phosphatase
MKTLYLLRHAKASWKDAKLDDFDRPLKRKGHFQAEALSGHLSSLVPPPQEIFCSPALRTRQTLEYFLGVWPVDAAQVHFPENLYLADRNALLECIQGVSKDTEVALIVGHNPGITDVMHFLDSTSAGYLSHLHTGEFVQIDFEENNWSDLGSDTGKVKVNLRSKDLIPE